MMQTEAQTRHTPRPGAGGWTRFLLLGLAAWAVPCAAQETSEPAPTPVRQLAIANKPWTGDFDRLLERRMIRVLVPFSRTLYFNDKGRERGLTADWSASSNSTSTGSTGPATGR